MRSGYK
jgi:ATP-dependent helicase STH1/SNF2